MFIGKFINQGAKSGGEMESAQAKNQALKEAGAVVPTSYEAFEAAIKETFDKLVSLSRNFLSITDIFSLSPSPIRSNILKKSRQFSRLALNIVVVFSFARLKKGISHLLKSLLLHQSLRT